MELRGLKANYNEILILMSLFSPSVICLQETFLKQSDNISFRDYNMFNYICPDGQRASGGTSIMVKSSVPYSQFDLYIHLQAVAVTVTLSKKVTICSIYLPPNDVAPCQPGGGGGGRNRWLLCACSRWVRPHYTMQPSVIPCHRTD